MPDQLLAALLGCPSCALGDGRAGAGGWLLSAVLAVLPLVVAFTVAWLIARTVRRAEQASPHPGRPPASGETADTSVTRPAASGETEKEAAEAAARS